MVGEFENDGNPDGSSIFPIILFILLIILILYLASKGKGGGGVTIEKEPIGFLQATWAVRLVRRWWWQWRIRWIRRRWRIQWWRSWRWLVVINHRFKIKNK